MNDYRIGINIHQLSISSYVQNILISNNIVTVEDLMKLQYQDLLKINNLSSDSISKITDCIRELMRLKISSKQSKKLTVEHYRQLLEISNGADIVGHYEARLLREVEEVRPEFITICNPMGKYSVKEELPFFGAITTVQGVKFSKEFLRIPRWTTDLLEMELSVRTVNGLRNYGVFTLEDVMAYTPKSLLKFKGIGPKSVREVIECLDSFGLKLKKDIK